MRVLIAGAGIGGLTAALMLHRRGIAAAIYEQAPTVREVGVGINTLPHAIGELADLGLLPALDRTGIRTRTLIYYNRGGQEVWREARGIDAGHTVPQFSIHRGRLQKLLHDAVLERLGPDSVRTGLSLAGFMQDEGGVTAHFTDTRSGDAGHTARGDVLVCADGIHSVARHHFYPDEGAPKWNGMMMWRGATESEPWLDGRTMAIGGGMGAKFVLYPIADAEGGRQLMNWVVNVVTASALAPPPKESWSRPAPRATVLPFARRFAIPGFDILRLVEATPQAFEYPMCDRDPLPRWTFDRVTLLGDAAHPMYPVGSNGASQAILDARALADALTTAEHPRQALWRYEQERRPKTAEIVQLNRGGGPERVIDEVEKRAPAGFSNVETILSYSEREAIVRGYAATAGFAADRLRRRDEQV